MDHIKMSFDRLKIGKMCLSQPSPLGISISHTNPPLKDNQDQFSWGSLSNNDSISADENVERNIFGYEMEIRLNICPLFRNSVGRRIVNCGLFLLMLINKIDVFKNR